VRNVRAFGGYNTSINSELRVKGALALPAAFVLELRRGLQGVLGGVHSRRPLLVVLGVDDLHSRRGDNDVALADTQEAAHRQDQPRQASIGNDEILDLTDVLFGVILNVQANEIAAENVRPLRLDIDFARSGRRGLSIGGATYEDRRGNSESDEHFTHFRILQTYFPAVPTTEPGRECSFRKHQQQKTRQRFRWRVSSICRGATVKCSPNECEPSEVPASVPQRSRQCPPHAVIDLSLALAEMPRNQAAETLSESAGTGGAFPVQDARGVEEQMSDIRSNRFVFYPCEPRDHLVAGVDLEDRLGRAIDAAGGAEQAFELTIRTLVRGKPRYRSPEKTNCAERCCNRCKSASSDKQSGQQLAQNATNTGLPR